MLKPISILYHCNDSKRCHKFVNDNTYMIVSTEDGIWLGTGMYFWDNQSNAKFWYKKKCKENPKEEYSIVQASVYMDHLLDLTDLDVCKSIEKLWCKYKEKAHISDSQDQPLGYKLNCLYKYFSGFADIFWVIKVFGKYNYTPKNDLFSYDLRSNKAEPITTVKCIYNVRNINAIEERVVLE